MKIKNKTVILSLVIFVLLSALVSATSVEVVFDKDSVDQGEQVIALINIADVTELHSFQFSLKYDDSRLELKNIEEGDFLSQGQAGKTFFVVRGNTVALTTLGPKGRSGSGYLFKASFTALRRGDAKLNLTAGKLINPDLELVSFDVLPGTITIEKVLVTPQCGDGKCDAIIGETCSSCPGDCGTCPPSEPGTAEQTNLMPIIIAITIIAVIALIAIMFRKKEKELVKHMIRHKTHKPGTSSEKIKQLKKYIDYCLSQGYSKESIKKVLVGQGWSQETIDKVLK